MATERHVKVRLSADPKGFIGGMKAAQSALHDLRKDIDTTNDRTAWLAQSFLALGPTLSPLGAVGVGALAGLATQMTFTAVAAGTLTLAFNGIGDALKALNDYQIDPTEAHLKALHKTMAFIGPTGRDLVRVLDEMRNSFIGLSNLTRDKMFPGVIEGLHDLSALGPQVEQIVVKVAGALGALASSAGKGLAGPRFKEFFDFLEADAAPTLTAMGHTLGNIADGFAAMLVAFAPLSRDFTGGMLNMSKAFADWAHGLRDNDTFRDFIDYIRESTPRVLDLIGQLVATLIQVAEAAAPVGDVMIPLLTTVLKLVEAIVDSPLGPVFIGAAAAMSVYGRAAALASITTGGLGGKIAATALGLDGLKASLVRTEVEFTAADASARRLAASLGATQVVAGRTSRSFGGFTKALGPAALTIGAFSLANSGLAEKIHLSHTAWGAFMGSLLGPEGIVLGAAVGATWDFSEALIGAMTSTRNFKSEVDTLASTLDQQTGAVTQNTEAFVKNQFAKQGVLDAARDIGIASDVIVDAYLGDAYAIYQVNQALKDVNESFYDSEGRVTVSSSTLDDYRGSLELVDSALAGGVTALAQARDGMILTGDEVDTTTRKFQKAAEQIDVFGQAVDDLDNKLERRSNWSGYQAAIDDLARGFRKDKNGLTLDWGTQKGRANNANLDAFAQSVKAISETLSGQARVDFLKDAFKQFDRLTEKLNLNDEQVKHLKSSLGLLGLKTATPTVKVGGVDIAQSKVDSLDRAMNLLAQNHRHTTLEIDVLFNSIGRHKGGATPGGFADGGYTGNLPANQPAGIVHGREFVFDAKATEGNVAMLSTLQDHLRGYRGGGYVAASPQPASGPPIDYERLGYVIARNAGQLYGDVHISGDPTVWRKQMEDDDRARSTGALR